ncbi:putative invasin [Xenorhabdus poinarii G6]|uniref:Putative invasin n=1 Tax=Xenorhabdus poinarii G6 TaxID=1354304 RepID=A0A068R749_9GAMM|nr:inverse autotransporter beta-barrel domain-containing protein [Xenorhabdus poinarii]CDG23048.1 putative invasin [Xenorhabdus poinarii G6]
MDSSISHKVIRLSVLIYSFCLPFTPMNAFSAAEKTSDNKTASNVLSTSENNVQPSSTERDQAGLIAQNVQRVGQLLSSSPAQLTEQAKSYALGKINNTFSSEAQKWLSQFGTAKIHFALDRKGKLDDGSLDLLLPLYDNKTDWLLFSQLGYRNKDSRHTLNLGLGGRYFTPKWMYGLNAFFDHDVTGQNKRLGLGGEAWTDYVKLSANTYWRLSNWHQSPKERDYEERPANGFDLNSEFFLPAYPNIGGKISYEHYVGDNVALFDRDTRQKDPSMARFGLNYTPIPLVTMGVDYKLGSGGHSETLFLANLNYRFGTPFGAQISPDNVASMRTLAGSRYDIVERNNNIVLDYQKKPTINITLPNTLNGYDGQPVEVTAQIATDKPLKQVSWKIDQAFTNNKGLLLPDGGKAGLVLPQYVRDGQNSYTLSATAEEEGGKSKTTQMEIVVDPFVVKAQGIQPAGKGPVIADGKSAYQLAATITHGNAGNTPIKNRAIRGVKWSLEPENPNAKLVWDESGSTNDQGQLTATLTSTEPLAADSKVFLEMDGMPKMAITSQGNTPLTFAPVDTEYQIVLQPVEPAGPLSIHNPEDIYTLVATILDKDQHPLRNKKIKATWTATPNDGVTLTAEDTTDKEGKLTATLKSSKAQAITVKLSIDKGPNKSFKPVSFVDDASAAVHIKEFTFDEKGPYEATVDNKVTVHALLVKKDGSPLKNTAVKVKWFTVPDSKALPGFTLDPDKETEVTTDKDGKVKATFSSSEAVKDARIGLSLNGTEVLSDPFDFTPDTKLAASLDKKEQIIAPDKPLSDELTIDSKNNRFKVKVLNGNGQPIPNQTVSGVTWSIQNKRAQNDIEMVISDQNTDEEGYLTASLVRKDKSKAGFDHIVVTATLGSSNVESPAVNIEAIAQKAGIRMSTKHTNPVQFKDIHSERNPFNVHPNLIISLLTPEGKELLKDKDNPDRVRIESTKPDVAKVDHITGQISFPIESFALGEITATATVTNQATGGKMIYSYLFDPKRYLFNPRNDTGGLFFTVICSSALVPVDTGNREAKLVRDDEFGATPELRTGVTFLYEYDQKNFPDFVLFPVKTAGEMPNIKILAVGNEEGKSEIYNFRTWEFVPFDSDKDSEMKPYIKRLCQLKL